MYGIVTSVLMDKLNPFTKDNHTMQDTNLIDYTEQIVYTVAIIIVLHKVLTKLPGLIFGWVVFCIQWTLCIIVWEMVHGRDILEWIMSFLVKTKQV